MLNIIKNKKYSFNESFLASNCITEKNLIIKNDSQIYGNINIINPWFITGFVDAEGSFLITAQQVKWSKLGWGVRASFKINIHLRDRDLLEQIKNFFGVGNIYISGTQASYEVNSLKDLDVIIAHFENYPLLLKKDLTLFYSN